MNAIGMMMSQVNTSSNTTAGTKPVMNAQGFKQALQAIEVGNETNVNAKELVAEMNEESDLHPMAGLLEVLSKLFGNVPLEQGFLAEEMITEESNKLLEQLPMDLQNEIMALFQSEAPLEELFTENQNPMVAMFSSLVVLGHFEQSGSVDLHQLFRNVSTHGQEIANVTADSVLNNFDKKQLLSMFQKTLGQMINGNSTSQGNKQVINSLLSETANISVSAFMKDVALKLEETQTERYKQTSLLGKGQLVNGTNVKHSLSQLNHNTNPIVQKGASQLGQPEAMSADVETIVDTKTVVNKTAFVEQAPMNRLQQYVIHVNQGENKQANQQQFIDQFQQIMKSSKFTAGAGQSELTIRLKPDNLGSMSVKLTQMNGEMMARIIVSSNSAKDLIESSIHQLRHVFTAQNIQVNKLDIVLQNNNQAFQESLKDQEKNGEQSGQSEREEQSEEREEAKSFEDEFEEELLNLMV